MSIKVLIVDDSVIFRTAIKSVLDVDGADRKFDVASNGKIGVQKALQEDFDIIIMDLEMPVMSGKEAIQEIRKKKPKIPIIVFSAHGESGAIDTLQALQLGANDFITKSLGGETIDENIELLKAELAPRIEAFLGKDSQQANAKKKVIGTSQQAIDPDYIRGLPANLICIGSSTGGPDALREIFSKFDRNFQTPILLVQHMPPVFTGELAKMLDKVSQIKVKEASQGEPILPGHCYIAPGDFHMEAVSSIQGGYQISLNQNEKECYVRPAFDVLLRSVAKNVKGRVVTFVLTGMGEDGLQGVKAMKEINSPIVIQDEESSVVWGMPGAVYNENLQDDVLPLNRVGETILKLVS